MEYATLEPFGEERADLRSGIVAALIKNTHRRPGAPPAKPSDFVLGTGRRNRIAGMDEWVAWAEAYAGGGSEE